MMSQSTGSFRGMMEVNGTNGASMGSFGHQPQIYTAVYSSVSVYEMEVHNVVVMKRRSDSWLNATQILKVAGVDKGKRTKVLEKEILTGEHEKVQGGYGKYQGTWINYSRGREFCRQYGVEDLLRPLLDYDVSADGSGAPGPGIDTPTKEQAMAANRKKLYTSMDARGGMQSANGTFFSNISPTATNAIAAMTKVARMNSPAPRPGSAQRRLGQTPSRPSMQPMNSQDSFNASQQSQQSQQSMRSDRSFGTNGHADSAYVTSSTVFNEASGLRPEAQEPPRKRMRPSSQQDDQYMLMRGNSDLSIRDGSPTEAAESFGYQTGQHSQLDGEVPLALPALPQSEDKTTEDKVGLLLDLFADLSRTDFTDHPAVLHLSGADLDLPLDQSANTAVHWAATLARVPLMRLLIARGASIFRGNAAGLTALMSAVQVNNCLDHSCFREVLEILAPTIEIRDHFGRTILHHIAVSCGIKGRAASSKYYLEALLEFLVRGSRTSNSQSSMYDQASSSQPGSAAAKTIGLMRFMSEMINVRDKAGNTALNLVARVGNRSIIQQLLEVQADVRIPNHKGLRPIDFGVGLATDMDHSLHQSFANGESPGKSKNPSTKIEESSRDMLPSLASFLSQTESQFSAEVRLKQDLIDRQNLSIRDLSGRQTLDLQRFEQVQRRSRLRSEYNQRLGNLQRASHSTNSNNAADKLQDHHVRVLNLPGLNADDLAADNTTAALSLPELAQQLQHLRQSDHTSQQPQNANTPSVATLSLRSRAADYQSLNRRLKTRAAQLKARNGELAAQYRKVVALCTGVQEGRVEETLPALMAAVESEGGDGVEMKRVNEFLRNMQGVAG